MAKKRAKSLTKTKRARAKKAPAQKRNIATSARRTANPKAAAPKPGDPLDALIDASAHALRLPLAPAWRGAVKGNLDVILRLAAQFADFPLPDDAEPAPVFVA
jgi:hypothetical protein